MKLISHIGIALTLASWASAQSAVYSHQFQGGEATPLHETREDHSGTPWTANGFTKDGPNYIFANGEVDTRGSAFLPYDFKTGTYAVKATVKAGSLNSIGFSTSPVATAAKYYKDQIATFGLRSTGDFEFFEISNTGIHDGGNLADYGIDGQTTGTLRLVLEWDQDTKTGTLLGYYLPEGGTEVQIDLDETTPGVNGITISPGKDLKGVGITFQNGSYQDFSFFAK